MTATPRPTLDVQFQALKDAMDEHVVAWDRFAGDRRVKPVHLRVYRWCRRYLVDHDDEPRKAPRDVVSHFTGIHRSHVGRALSALVAWGYLKEHFSGEPGPRRFTLCHREGANAAPLHQPRHTLGGP